MKKLSSFVCMLIIQSLWALSAHAADRPNVVFILTDNHGAWTLGCYGNPDIKTPNIDRLANEGVIFDRAFASNPVCSPSRATFLTGLLPSQHGVHCPLATNGLQVGPDARNTLDDFTSLPEILKAQGYSCGLVGKWHLGGNLNTQEGLCDYWVTMPAGSTKTFYDAEIIEEGVIRNEPQYLTDFWTDHAVKFIEKSAGQDRPFFLYLAYNGPYCLGPSLLEEGKNRHASFYADKDLLSFPRERSHPWLFHNQDYHNNATSIRRVATEVSGVDDGVGKVLETIKSLGLDQNTLVVFAGDQGWAGGQGGFFGMGDHTRPVTAREDMMRMPLIWRHPGKIAAGIRSDRLVSNYDFLASMLGHLGLEEKVPILPRSPGVDYSAEFMPANLDSENTDKTSAEDDAIFYEFEGLRCIRTGDWKYIHRHANGPHELYDLKRDPHEFSNLAESPMVSELRDTLQRRLIKFFDQYAEPKYDLWHGGGAQERILVGVDNPLPIRELVPPPMNDAFRQPEIKVPAGFTVELAAGPPLVHHPMFATFDDQGQLYVCENAGVNMTAEELEQKLPNSIRLLRDSDGDGIYETSTVFADKMTLPMGGAWNEGALFVASPPYIWRLEDTDRDGVADKREIVVGKFGHNGNGCDIHGCFMGPDGRIYWCDGYHGHRIEDRTGNVISERKGSYLFSCLPDGTDLQIHCGGGMDNPVEVDFSDEGAILGTVNILYNRPRVDCFMHWIYGGAYPHREQVLDEVKTTGELLTPMHRFGHVAASGAMRYRSGVMDHQWRDHFFVTQFNTGKVVRLELTPEGATFKATQREFLSSTSRDFHPTDVIEDADGSLLVLDTGGWYYRGCPTSQHSKPDVLGGIYRVRRTGMTPQVDPRGLRIEWNDLKASDLLGHLHDTRPLVREQAIAASARRGDEFMAQLAIDPAPRDHVQRRNIVWAMTRIIARNDSENAVSKAREIIRGALHDPHPSVRLSACNSLTSFPDREATNKLLGLLETDVASIRRQSATALGRIGKTSNASVVPALLNALSRKIDRSEEHSIIYALIEIADAAATRNGIQSADSEVRRGVLIAMDQMHDSQLTPQEVIDLLDDESDAVRQASVDIVAGRNEWSSHYPKLLEMLLSQKGSIEQNASLIKRLTTLAINEPAVQELVGNVLGSPSSLTVAKKSILSGIANSAPVPLQPNWEVPIRNLLKSNDADLVFASLQAVSSIQTNAFDEALTSIANDESHSPLLRVDAMQAVANEKGMLAHDALELLIKTIESGSPSQVEAAAQRIGGSTLSSEQLLRLSSVLTRVGASSLLELMKPFERSASREVAEGFLIAIQNSTILTSIPSHSFSDVIKRFPAELLPKANELLDKILAEEQARIARLDEMLSELPTGNAVRGREIFVSNKAACLSCHRVGDDGGNIGPNLTSIGSNRSPRDLLEAVMFPSATIVRDYESKVLLTTDGRTLSGIVTRETKGSLYLQQKIGDPIEVAINEIESVSPHSISIMPSGLEDTCGRAGLLDVVTYLVSCDGQVSAESGSSRENSSDPKSSAASSSEPGFQSLFDGKTLNGWTGAVSGYEVRDGSIVCVQAKRANLFFDRPFNDFVLRFEVSIPEGGNNGIAIRSPRTTEVVAYEGMEIQILDDRSPLYAELKPYQYHGSLYGLAPAKRGTLKPTNEWNQMEISAVGPHLEVSSNGVSILDVDLDKISKTDAADGRAHPGLARSEGYIGFLGHGSLVKYRNVRIKDLATQEGTQQP